MRKNILCCICLIIAAGLSAQNLSNKGTDFWTGFGFHARMINNNNSNGAFLSIYIAAGAKAATVRISLPGVADPSFPRTISVPANTSVEVTNFPRGDVNVDEFNAAKKPDCRLYFTGITKRGIHIESTNGAPIAVYEHTYGSDAAGATLLFPTNTWGATYNVLTIGGTTNSGIANSFFFVMAAEDNTLVDIVPTADIQDSSSASIFKNNGNQVKYPKGVPFTISLNKGEIFNAMGTVVNKVGGDLTGTLVKSQDCANKKIMVMAGNGRTFVNTNGCNASSGSDNLLQQMFPRIAWGTKYVSTPTKTMEYGIYRICVQDPSTIVKVNGQDITAAPFNASLISSFYYQIETNAFLNVESDKPIMMVQYIITGNCKSSTVGNNGQGDPEMIILSPVQQAINNISVFSPSKQNINTGGSYINVVIPAGGETSFKIDGKATVDTGNSSYGAGVYGSSAAVALAAAFRPHPADPNYKFARFKVSSDQSHSLSSDSGFNAIAYGMVGGESYGFNAGTLIKDLTAVVFTKNPQLTVRSPKTCVNNTAGLQVSLPYNRSQITGFEWDPSNVPANIISSQAVVSSTEATAWASSYTEGSNTYNVYNAPVPYAFSQAGTYRIFVTVTGTFLSECGSKQVIPIDVEVIRDTADFNILPDGCGSAAVLFKDTSRAGDDASIVSWSWNFGDNSAVVNQQNPPKHNYASTGIFDVKLTTVNSVGCVSDTIKKIDLSAGLSSNFSLDKDSVCSNGQIAFTSNAVSSGAAGNITNYTWILKQLPSSPPATRTGATLMQTFVTAGKYEIAHQVKTDAGCLSALVKDTIEVMPIPAPDFDLPSTVCVPGAVTFTNKTTIADNTIGSVTYLWYFGDGSPKTTTKDGAHTYKTAPPAVPGYYSISLNATSAFGCASGTKIKQLTDVYAPPRASFIAPKGLCPASVGNFADASTASGGQTITSYAWNFGDGQSGTGASATHTYATAGNYPVTLTVTSNKGCVDDTTINVLIDASPVMKFSWTGTSCANSPLTFSDNSTGIGTITKWNWDFGDGTTSTLQNPQHAFASSGTKKVSLQVETTAGCKNVPGTLNVLVHPSPVADFLVPAAVCLPKTTNFSNRTKISDATLGQTTYVWDFDDNGSTSTSTNSSHVYTAPRSGGYNVHLTATSINGCVHDTIKNFNNLYEIPLAGFYMVPTPVCVNVAAVFTDTSKVTGGQKIVRWEWNFGDGKVAEGYPMEHQYPGPGTYLASLGVTTDKGCASDASPKQAMVVNHVPVPDFTAVPGTICLGDSILFSDHSTDVRTTIVSTSWEFGDGNTGSLKNNWHQYASTGTYTVKLTVENGAGCKESKTGTVKVLAFPKLNLADEVWIRPGSSITLQPSVTNVSGSTVSYNWSPPTYLSSTSIKSPVSTPRSDQVYILTVSLDDGCTVTDSIAVNLLKDVMPPNAFSPNGDGINDVWNIPHLQYYTGNKVEVFDRYGRLVWKSDGYSKPWNGTVNGNPLPVGVYYYIIDPKNGYERITGSVTIVR